MSLYSAFSGRLARASLTLTAVAALDAVPVGMHAQAAESIRFARNAGIANDGRVGLHLSGRHEVPARWGRSTARSGGRSGPARCPRRRHAARERDRVERLGEPDPAQRDPIGSGIATIVTVVAVRCRRASRVSPKGSSVPTTTIQASTAHTGAVLPASRPSSEACVPSRSQRVPVSGCTTLRPTVATPNDQRITRSGSSRPTPCSPIRKYAAKADRRAEARGTPTPSSTEPAPDAGRRRQAAPGQREAEPTVAGGPARAARSVAHRATRIGAWYSSSSAIPTGSRSIATK